MPSYPQGDLETPFLKEELFVGESEAGWEARVAALEAESPFQSALEQDQTTLIEAKEMEAEMLAEELVEEGKQAVSAHFPVEQADSYSEEAEQSADLVDGLNAEKFSEEEDELEEVLTDEEEEESRAVDEILSGLDRAVSLNRRYGEELGWRIQDDTIARFLGFIDYSPDEKTFAEAIARWQRSQSLKGDGILGPETWARLRAALPADNRERFPARSQPTSFIPTPVEAPGGERIKDLTEPRQAELTTVEGFGGKPVELHRLAAEAWTALVQAARSDGFGAPLLLPISGYRSVKRQEVLWQEALRKYGSREKARKWVAPPGGSAHQTGRAIDFYLGGKNSSSNVANLRKLSVYRWLVANAAGFGFYPYEREPWHWEYNPPAHRHEQEQGESVLLRESDDIERAQQSGFLTEDDANTAVSNLLGAPSGDIDPTLISALVDSEYLLHPDLTRAALCEPVRQLMTRWESVKLNMVRIARDECQNTWNNGTRKETDTAMRQVIENYWRYGVYSGALAPAHEKTKDKKHIQDNPWSAAFIAWVVNQAGGSDRFSKVDEEANYRTEPAGGFRPAAHWRYVAPSKLNRELPSLKNPFWAFAIDETPPQRGDIVVKSREGSRATFNNFEGKVTHGDIVVDVVGANNITVIGGNVSVPGGKEGVTVRQRTVPLDANGFVQSTGGINDDHFAIVRINTDMYKVFLDSPICQRISV